MARIPDRTDLGERVLPGVSRPTQVDNSGQIIAEGVDQLGRTVGAIGRDVQEKDDKFNYALAKSDLLQADITARRALENDPNWQTYEPRYREAMKKAREAAAARIRSPRDRAAFDLDSNLDVERGSVEVYKQARAREIDQGRADVLDRGEKLRNTGLLANDNGSRVAAMQTYDDLLDGAYRKGYIDKAQVVTMRQRWAADYGEASVSMLSPQDQVTALSNPKGTAAEAIDPDKRAVMLRQAERLADLDKRAALAEADAAIARRERQAADAAWKVVAAGGRVKDIPRQVWNGLSGQGQVALLDDEKTRLTGGKVETDWNKYYALKTMATHDPRRFAEVPLTDYFGSLAEGERKELIGLQTKAADGGDNLDAATLSQQVGAVTTGWPADYKGPFEVAVQKRVDQENAAAGRKLKFSERQDIIDEMLISGEVEGFPWNRDKKAYEVAGTPAEATFTPDDYEKISLADRAEIEASLRRNGRQVTKAAVTLWYKRLNP